MNPSSATTRSAQPPINMVRECPALSLRAGVDDWQRAGERQVRRLVDKKSKTLQKLAFGG